MINLLIINNKSYCHLEIIESIIVNYHEVIKFKIPPSYIQLFLILKEDCDESFIRYIKYKYPKIQFTSPKFIDYTININFYPSDKYFKRLENSNPKFNFLGIFLCISKTIQYTINLSLLIKLILHLLAY